MARPGSRLPARRWRRCWRVVPDDLELGFMTYGHREKGACDDIELLVEPGSRHRPKRSARQPPGITPKGKTPISAAVELAAEDLQYTEDKATVILITDGSRPARPTPARWPRARGPGRRLHHPRGRLRPHRRRRQAGRLPRREYRRPVYRGRRRATRSTEALADHGGAGRRAPAEPGTGRRTRAGGGRVQLRPADGDRPKARRAAAPTTPSIIWEINKANADGSDGEYVATEYGVDYKGNLEPGDYLRALSVGYARCTCR